LTSVLFICGKNKWRSPTAENIFADHPGVQCASAGLSHDAEVALSAERVEWADLIFVMEKAHKTKLSARFKTHLAGKRVVCLGIPDNYQFMQPALVNLLRLKVTPHLPDSKWRLEGQGTLHPAPRSK
jgi:predicted protein tyrosine phosphatase